MALLPDQAREEFLGQVVVGRRLRQRMADLVGRRMRLARGLGTRRRREHQPGRECYDELFPTHHARLSHNGSSSLTGPLAVATILSLGRKRMAGVNWTDSTMEAAGTKLHVS